jgi:DNA repair ATPase RecN
MRKILVCILFFVFAFKAPPAKAQVEEIEQLVLDIEKLSQLKQILADLYTGYEILTKGYNTIRDLAEGNFNIHQLFLDGLLSVSPTVKKYKRIVDIVSGQQTLIREYQSALSHFKGLHVFSPEELSYVGTVYQNLADGSLRNLDELLMVITDSQLRMNDAERLTAIDRIYEDLQNKLDFLRSFNNSTALLATQKQKELDENQLLKKLYGIQNR